uniref:Uncharacterized protein n=1 Tax=Riboviria sp. TaxID=2585031 RepID=A0A8K1WQK8_9VIRU|nr:MAG: hypothetical protein 2 [Riboviria sp.]
MGWNVCGDRVFRGGVVGDRGLATIVVLDGQGVPRAVPEGHVVLWSGLEDVGMVVEIRASSGKHQDDAGVCVLPNGNVRGGGLGPDDGAFVLPHMIPVLVRCAVTCCHGDGVAVVDPVGFIPGLLDRFASSRAPCLDCVRGEASRRACWSELVGDNTGDASLGGFKDFVDGHVIIDVREHGEVDLASLRTELAGQAAIFKHIGGLGVAQDVIVVIVCGAYVFEVGELGEAGAGTADVTNLLGPVGD